MNHDLLTAAEEVELAESVSMAMLAFAVPLLLTGRLDRILALLPFLLALLASWVARAAVLAALRRVT